MTSKRTLRVPAVHQDLDRGVKELWLIPKLLFMRRDRFESFLLQHQMLMRDKLVISHELYMVTKCQTRVGLRFSGITLCRSSVKLPVGTLRPKNTPGNLLEYFMIFVK